MKKACIACAAALLIFSFFREFTFLKVLFMISGLAAVWLFYKVPARYIEAMKYPLIVANFLVTVLFFIWPKLKIVETARFGIVFLAFYSLMYYLSAMEEKQRDFFKELTALSILFFSACFNLYMAKELLLVTAFALTVIILLFILDRIAMAPFIAGYTLTALIISYSHGSNILSKGFFSLAKTNLYILFASSFVLLVMSFVAFTKKGSFAKLLPFFGLLYIALDVLLVLGLKLSTGLLYQPVLFLVLFAPFMGVMLKAEGERS